MCFGPTEKKKISLLQKEKLIKRVLIFWLIMKIYRKTIDEKSTQFIFQL